jgi:hypothetical protein
MEHCWKNQKQVMTN